LYYHARYYDPSVARFVSPDSIVPGAASGVGGARGTVGLGQNSLLAVDFHETLLAGLVNGENRLVLSEGYWSTALDREGPDNPQALGRYSYVLNNPLRYIYPTGHDADYQCMGCPPPQGNSAGGGGGSSSGMWGDEAIIYIDGIPYVRIPGADYYVPYVGGVDGGANYENGGNSYAGGKGKKNKGVKIGSGKGKPLPPDSDLIKASKNGAKVFVGKEAPDHVYSHLEKYHGVPRHVASNRLHKIKQRSGLGADDNVFIDQTGNVYHPYTGEYLGTLTDKGIPGDKR
jgi:hypothetical protein